MYHYLNKSSQIAVVSFKLVAIPNSNINSDLLIDTAIDPRGVSTAYITESLQL